MRIFKSAFEKLSADSFDEIAKSSKRTADTLNPGGDLFELISQIATSATNSGSSDSFSAARDAAILSILGKRGISDIGKSFQVLVNALNSIEDAEDAAIKMKVLTEGISNLADMGKKLVKFALQMMIAGPLLLLSVPSIIISMPFIFSFVKLFKWIDKQGIGESAENTAKAFSLMGLGLVSLALGVVGFSYLLPPTDPNTYKSIAIAGLTVLGLTSVFVLAEKFKVGENAPKVSIALVIMGASILSIGIAINLFSRLVPPGGEGAMAVAGVALAIGSVSLLFSLAGIAAPFIKKGAISILLSAGAIAAIGLSFHIFASAVPPTPEGWTTIGQVSAALLGIGLVMGLAGAAAAFIVPGAAAMIIAGIGMTAISFGIVQMKKAFSGGGVDNMLADSGQKTEGFLGFGAGRSMSRLEWMMLSIARSFALPPAALIGLAAGVVPMTAAGAAMLLIGKGIQKFQALDIDYTVFPNQVRNIVFTLADVFGEIGTKYPGGRNSLLKRIFSGDGGSPVADGISAVVGMGGALTSIAIGVQAMSDLRFPTKYDKNGNPIEFTTLSSDYAIKLTANIRSIVSSLSTVFGEIGNDPTLGKGGRKGLLARVFGGGGGSPVADGISAVMGMGESLSSIATGVQSMADLKFPIYDAQGKITGYQSLGDINDIEARLIKNTRKLVSSLSSVFGQIGKSPDAEDPWGWFGKSNIERGIGLVEQFGKPLSTLTEAAKTFGDQNFSEAKIKSRLQGLIGIFVGDTGIIGKDNYEAAGSMWYNIDSAFDTMGNEFENIADGINEMDLEKVKEARMMFEAISALSNSPKDDILREMGDSIESALVRLAELLEEFKGNVSDGNVASQQIGAAVDTLAGMFMPSNNSNQSEPATITVDVQPVADEIDNLRNLLMVQGIKIKDSI